MTRHLLWFTLAFTVGCGPSALTREGAADLLANALERDAGQNLQLATLSGCFTLAPKARVHNSDVELDPQLAGLPYLMSTLRIERELGLIEFEFAESPMDAPVPPSGCGRLWAAQHAAHASTNAAAQSKLVAWKSNPKRQGDGRRASTGRHISLSAQDAHRGHTIDEEGRRHRDRGVPLALGALLRGRAPGHSSIRPDPRQSPVQKPRRRLAVGALRCCRSDERRCCIG